MRITSFLLFLIVIIVFILLMSRAGLYKFQGTKHKSRIIYVTALGIFFSLYFMWHADWNLSIITKGFLLSLILTPPIILYTKRWIRKRLEGTTLFYPRNIHLRSWLWFMVFWICWGGFFRFRFGRQVLNAEWPILGLCFSWVISEVVSLLLVSKMEGKLGAPIMEDMR